MEKTTEELIFTELLAIRSEVRDIRSEMREGFAVINKKIDGLDERLTNVEKDISSLIQTVQFIGDKVFDNHERRIKAIEIA